MHNGPNDLATALQFQSKLDDCVPLFRTAFTLARDGCSRHDMLAHPSRYNTATNRRQERRPLTAEELAWLLDVTEDASTGCGVQIEPCYTASLLERGPASPSCGA